MARPARGYKVTVAEYAGRGSPRREREYETVAVSVRQAVNNVAHRLGVHFTEDRPYHDTGERLLHAAVVECEGRTVMLF